MATRKKNDEEALLTPEEFEEALVARYKSRPVVVDESELREELRQTAVLRYARGVDLLKQVSDTLAEALTEAGDTKSKKKLELAASNIEQAVKAFGYGHLGYNRCARADKGIHPHLILWNGEESAGKKK